MPAETAGSGRRVWLKLIAALCGGGALASTLYPILGGTGPMDQWVELGSLDDYAVGVPALKHVTVTEQRRIFFGLIPYGRLADRRIWVVRQSLPEATRVFTATCPHKSCFVDSEPDGFFCGCHKSRFDAAGGMVSGPALRGMDTLEFRVENAMLSVRFRNFRKDQAGKEVVS